MSMMTQFGAQMRASTLLFMTASRFRDISMTYYSNSKKHAGPKLDPKFDNSISYIKYYANAFTRCMFPTAQATATLAEETPATKLEVMPLSNSHISGMLHFIFEKQVTPSTARLLWRQLSLTFLIRCIAKTSTTMFSSQKTLKTIHTETKDSL